jgi:hypothetical protein
MSNGKATVIRFRYSGDLRKAVEEWCAAKGFSAKNASGACREYQKGNGWTTPPILLRIRHTPQDTMLEACLLFGELARLCSFYTLPPEMGLESGGYSHWLNRSQARKTVNTLLAKLGQAGIS